MEQLIELPKFLEKAFEVSEYVPDTASKQIAIISGIILALIGFVLLFTSISALNEKSNYKSLTLESYKAHQNSGRLGLLIIFIGVVACLQYNLTTTIVLPSVILGILIFSLWGLVKGCIAFFSGLVKIFSKPQILDP